MKIVFFSLLLVTFRYICFTESYELLDDKVVPLLSISTNFLYNFYFSDIFIFQIFFFLEIGMKNFLPSRV